MGKIFSSAALSPFLMQFTIHRREQIAACAVSAKGSTNTGTVQSVFDTYRMLWQILAEVTVLKLATFMITRH